MKENTYFLTIRTLHIILTIIVGLHILRIVFQLLAANSAAAFVAWLYTVTDMFISPFRGIFPNVPLSQGGVIDVVAFISLLFYIFMIYFIIAVIRDLSSPKDTYITIE